MLIIIWEIFVLSVLLSWPRRVGAGWWLSIQRGRNSKGHFPKIKKTKVNSSYLAKDKREITQIFLRRDKKTNEMIWPRPSLVEELSLRKIDPALVWKKRLMKVLPYLFRIDVKLGQRWCWCHHGIISSNWYSALCLFQNGTLQACGVHQEGTFQCQHWHLQVFHPHTVCSQPRKNTCKASRLCTPAGLHRSRPVKSLLI